jgi:hypothetical protein
MELIRQETKFIRKCAMIGFFPYVGFYCKANKNSYLHDDEKPLC